MKTVIYCHMAEIAFHDWLEDEISKRNWKPADFCKTANIDSGFLSKVLSGERNPGLSFIERAASALDYPKEFVFRKAGILPPAARTTEQHEELTYLFDRFPDDEKKDLLSYMRIKLTMLEREGKIKDVSK